MTNEFVILRIPQLVDRELVRPGTTSDFAVNTSGPQDAHQKRAPRLRIFAASFSLPLCATPRRPRAIIVSAPTRLNRGTPSRRRDTRDTIFTPRRPSQPQRLRTLRRPHRDDHTATALSSHRAQLGTAPSLTAPRRRPDHRNSALSPALRIEGWFNGASCCASSSCRSFITAVGKHRTAQHH